MGQMRIGEVAERTGLSIGAIRFYEDQGLLQPVARTPSGYRMYDAEALSRLQFVRRAKALGLSLADIAAILRSPDAASERAAMRHSIVHRLADVRSRVGELQALEQSLQRLYVQVTRGECTCRHLGDCTCAPLVPSFEEMTAMTNEMASLQATRCTCAGDAEPEAGACTCSAPADPPRQASGPAPGQSEPARRSDQDLLTGVAPGGGGCTCCA